MMIRSSLLRMVLGRPWPIRQMLSHPVFSARGVSLPPCPFCLGANRQEGPAEAKTNSGSEIQMWWWSAFQLSRLCFCFVFLCSVNLPWASWVLMARERKLRQGRGWSLGLCRNGHHLPNSCGKHKPCEATLPTFGVGHLKQLFTLQLWVSTGS